MNDRFKFRVWNTISKKLRNVAQITFDARQHGCFSEIEDMETCKIPNQPHLILEQYTGLKDSAGKEIYEGDIIAFDDDEDIGVVKWDDIAACFYIETQGEVYTFDCCGGLDFLQIIGNIHENPELLEEKNENS